MNDTPPLAVFVKRVPAYAWICFFVGSVIIGIGAYAYLTPEERLLAHLPWLAKGPELYRFLSAGAVLVVVSNIAFVKAALALASEQRMRSGK